MKLSGSEVLLMGRFLIRNSTSVIDNICKKGPLNFCIYFCVSFDHLDFSRNCLISSKLSDLVSLFIIFIYYLFNICRICSDFPFVFRNIHYLYFLVFPLLILVQVFITFVSLCKTQVLVVLLLFRVYFPFQ